jgi:hypothetical protein
MRVPAEPTDPDLVLADCKRLLLHAHGVDSVRGIPRPQDMKTAAPAHTVHPLRHYDRTCPACIAGVPETQKGLKP